MCPFDRVQIDAILEHLPQRRHFAQFADLFMQELDGVVDLFLGGERIETSCPSDSRSDSGAQSGSGPRGCNHDHAG